MNILIKGVEMPKDKAIAVVIHPDGTAYSVEMFAGVCTNYLTDCEAIPVPPHGRLIDADALLAKDNEDFARIMELTDPATVFGTALADAHTAIQEALLTAPTIIPADKGEEG